MLVVQVGVGGNVPLQVELEVLVLLIKVLLVETWRVDLLN
jgi:hypothetical protein